MIEWNGKCLVQSCAIARMFAKRGDLLGSNEEEATQIDILFSGTRDFYDNYFLLYGFQGIFLTYVFNFKINTKLYLNKDGTIIWKKQKKRVYRDIYQLLKRHSKKMVQMVFWLVRN